jgi:hypothetical protein
MNNQTHIAEEAMNEYLDGLLGQEEQDAFEGHLERCTECCVRLAELRFVFQAMDELPEVMLERDFQPEILRAIAPAIVSNDISIAESSHTAKMDRGLSSTTWLIFIIQLIAAGFLFFFAIPSVLGRIPLSVVQQYTRQVQMALVILLQNSLPEWRQLWGTVQNFTGVLIRFWEQGIRLPGWIQISSLEVFILLAVVTLLWVMVNGWLLWRRKLGNHISIWL